MPQSETDILMRKRLEDLHEAARKLGIDVEYTRLDDSEYPVASGHCKVRGRDLILLDKTLAPVQHMEIILNVLKKFNLDAVYVPAWVRDRLDGAQKDFPSP